MTRTRIVRPAALLLGLLCLSLPGCSLLHFGGEMAAKAPGVHYESGGLFPAKLAITSDAKADIQNVDIDGPIDPNGNPVWHTKIAGTFGQDVTTPMKELTGIIKAIPDIQRVQVEYIHEVRLLGRDVAKSLAGMVSPVSAISGVFETAFENSDGGIPTRIANFLAEAKALQAALQANGAQSADTSGQPAPTNNQ